MKFNSMPNLVLLFCAALTLAGCSKTVDFRNIEISNNLIYEKGENKGLTGKITNMPLTKMPIQNISKLAVLVSNVSKNTKLGDIFLAASLEERSGNGSGRIVCDTVASDGVLDGVTDCKIPEVGTPIFSFSFKKNLLDGKMTIYDAENKGNVIAEGTYKDGLIEGPAKVYSYKTGKLLYTVNWKNGVLDGPEEVRSEATNNVVAQATFENGKYNGEMKKFTADGVLTETSTWVKGQRQEAAPVEAVAPEALTGCLDSWMNSFRKSEGAEASISQDQIDEWKDSCKNGKLSG